MAECDNVVSYDSFLIRRLLRAYNGLVAASGKPRKPVGRDGPTSILKSTQAWRDMERLVGAAKEMAADPFVFLEAQFSNGRVPYTAELGGDKSKLTYVQWMARQRELYGSSASAASAPEVVTTSDRVVALNKALKVGEQLWAQLQIQHGTALSPVDLANTVPNMIPAQFLLSFPDVEAGVRSGTIKSELLSAMVTYLDVNNLWGEIKQWRQARGNV